MKERTEILYPIYEEDNEAFNLVMFCRTKEEVNRQIRKLKKENPDKNYGSLKCSYPC